MHGAHGVVVSHPLSMREALGSIPSVSTFAPSVDFFITPWKAALVPGPPTELVPAPPSEASRLIRAVMRIV